jgi:hypothetical protein
MRRSLAGTILAAALVLSAPTDAAELVYVFEPGCPYCRLWDREIAPVYPKTAEGKQAALLPLDRRDPALAELKLAGPVRYTPTFVLVNEGVELGRIEGYPGEDFFWSRLDGLLERLPQEMPKTTTQ